MANPESIERAFFQVEGSQEKLDVHFNPETLQYTITNNLKNQGSGNSTKQYVSDSTGKLTMDLVFDSTTSGEDIRLKTSKVAKLMEPDGQDSEKTPPVVNFEWGLYRFKGMLESYKETIDYFSSDGVPLRSSVNITMSSQDNVFEGGSNAKKAATGGSAGLPNSAIPAVGNNSATDLATIGGNPGAAKAIASSNGLDSMRFSQGAAIELNSSVSLQGAAGFASAGAGLNVGLDSGLNLSAGTGGSLSAGVGASAGAFSGLQSVSENSAASSLRLDKFIAADASSTIGLDSNAVGLGGGISLQGSANFKAEVGSPGELKSAIEFDGG